MHPAGVMHAARCDPALGKQIISKHISSRILSVNATCTDMQHGTSTKFWRHYSCCYLLLRLLDRTQLDPSKKDLSTPVLIGSNCVQSRSLSSKQQPIKKDLSTSFLNALGGGRGQRWVVQGYGEGVGTPKGGLGYAVPSPWVFIPFVSGGSPQML